MLFLSIICCMIACCAAAVYVQFENWEYFDALYFCFVSFATIGFGDFVSTQNLYYPYIHWYVSRNLFDNICYSTDIKFSRIQVPFY